MEFPLINLGSPKTLAVLLVAALLLRHFYNDSSFAATIEALRGVWTYLAGTPLHYYFIASQAVALVAYILLSRGQCLKKPKRQVKKKDWASLIGKRSSQRLRLSKHELSFIERISPEEFDR